MKKTKRGWELDMVQDIESCMRRLTKVEAYKALRTQYGKDNLEDYTMEDLQDDTQFVSDNYAFYAIDESNWDTALRYMYCDNLVLRNKELPLKEIYS